MWVADCARETLPNFVGKEISQDGQGPVDEDGPVTAADVGVYLSFEDDNVGKAILLDVYSCKLLFCSKTHNTSERGTILGL